MEKQRIKNILSKIFLQCELESITNKKKTQICNDYATRSCLGCRTCCAKKAG